MVDSENITQFETGYSLQEPKINPFHSGENGDNEGKTSRKSRVLTRKELKQVKSRIVSK